MTEVEVQNGAPESDSLTPVEEVSKKAASDAPIAQTVSASGRAPIKYERYAHFVVEAVFLIMIMILAAQLVNVRSHNRSLQAQLSAVESNPQALVQKQTDDLIVKVGSLMSLPTGETPTVVAVTDAPTAAKQSAFFANAINGDKVLMYVKAGEAILYRPSTNKIILVGPLKLNDTQSSTSQQ